MTPSVCARVCTTWQANFIWNRQMRSKYRIAQHAWRAALRLDETMCACHDGLSLLAGEYGRKADARQHETDRDRCIAAVRRRYRWDPLLEADLVLR